MFARTNYILSLALSVGSSEHNGRLERMMYCVGSLKRIEDRSSDHYQFLMELDFFTNDLEQSFSNQMYIVKKSGFVYNPMN